jgi:hypothetical protein
VLTQEPSFYVNQIKHEHQIDLRIKDLLSLYLKASCSKQMSFSKGQNVETLITTLIELYMKNIESWLRPNINIEVYLISNNRD